MLAGQGGRSEENMGRRGSSTIIGTTAGMILCLGGISSLAREPASASEPTPPPNAAGEAKNTVSIPVYNPRCHSWIPVSQTYREVPVEEAVTAWKAYEECRYP